MFTSVADSTGHTPNLEMSVLGYLIALALLVLLLPLLPVIALVWLGSKLAGSTDDPSDLATTPSDDA